MTDVNEAVKRLERYMECGESVQHSAATYRDSDGSMHLLTFDDIRTVLDALDAAESGIHPADEWYRMKRERDEALAVIERAKAIHAEREWRPLDGTYLGGTVCNHCRKGWPCSDMSILSRVPADVLRERDAEKWQEGRESVALDFTRPLDEAGIRKPTPNPYRETKEQG